LSWRLCSGSPSSLDACIGVGGTTSSSYSVPRNGDWKLFAILNHARRAGCTLSGSVSSNLGNSGTNGLGPQSEVSVPNPVWVGYGFDSRVAPSTTAYRASFDFVERCTGLPDNAMSGSTGIAVQ
jgi:hypothetical protein